jgi:hypothetical protein
VTKLVAAALATAALAVAAGCGGGGSSASASPETWASDVCSAASSWMTDLQTQSESLEGTMEEASSIEDVRDRLVEFVDGAIERTDEMLSEIEAAGSPDVENGEQLAEDFREVLANFSTALDEVRTTAEGLSDDPAQFAEGVQQIAATMAEVGGDIQEGMDDLREQAGSDELNEAFDSETSCQELDETS